MPEFAARFAGVEPDVVADRIRRPESNHGFRIEPAFGDDLLQHVLRVFIKLAGSLSLLLVGEDFREAPAQLPSAEERRPIDIGDQFLDIISAEDTRARKERLGRQVIGEIELEPVRPCLRERHARLVEFGTRVGIRDLLIFGAHLVDIGAALVAREQRLNRADRAARVGDVDRLAAMIVGMDFHRRMHAARRRPANEQREIETFALHFGCDEAHFLERGRDEAGETDDIDILGLAVSRIFAAGTMTPRSMIS